MTDVGTLSDPGPGPAGGLAVPVRTWSVGVTTAPRRKPTLAVTLASLARAGWDRPRLFAEPGAEVPAAFSGLPVSRRDETLGAFPNWLLGLAELVLRDPAADAYLMAQDDVLFSAGLRGYLERTLWPDARCGVVSVHCPSHLSAGLGLGYHALDLGWDAWGAQGYVFSNPSARALLADPLPVLHRRHGPREGLRNVDSLVGLWCRLRGRAYCVHVPSLAQHVGEASTLWPGATTFGRRRAGDFAADVAALPAAAGPAPR